MALSTCELDTDNIISVVLWVIILWSRDFFCEFVDFDPFWSRDFFCEFVDFDPFTLGIQME